MDGQFRARKLFAISGHTSIGRKALSRGHGDHSGMAAHALALLDEAGRDELRCHPSVVTKLNIAEAM
jgi:hypothetical protein